MLDLSYYSKKQAKQSNYNTFVTNYLYEMSAHKPNIGVAGKFRGLHNHITFERLIGEHEIQILSNIEVEDGAIAASRKIRLIVKTNSPDLCNALVSVCAVDEKGQQVLCRGIKRKNMPSVQNSPLLGGNTSSILILDDQSGYTAMLKFFFKELSFHHDKKKFAACIIVNKASNIIFAGKTPYFEVRDRLRVSRNIGSRSYKKRKRNEGSDKENRGDKEFRVNDNEINDMETEKKRRHDNNLIEINSSIEKCLTVSSFTEMKLLNSNPKETNVL
jgi:hypothetical protein